MNSKSLIRLTHALIASSCFLGFAQVAAAAAGKILFVAGSVTRERGGSALKAGDALELGDVIVTGAQSRAQILMADGARIALRASSSFRVDELALPASVRTPAMSAGVTTSGRSVGTLLKGGFSTRDGAVGKANPSGYEMRTPVGTLGIRGTQYTAVLCRGDCADAPGQLPGQPIPDGLYLAVDEGTITFNGRGLSLTLTAPRFEFIPLETGDPQQLNVPPTFLRNDGAGALELAGTRVRIAASNTALVDVNERRSPSETGAQGAVAEQPSSDAPPERTIAATSLLGRPLDLTDGQIPPPASTSVATAVPASGAAGFTASNTALSDAFTFDATGNLVQFDAPFGARNGAVPGTYLSGTASLVDAGSDSATGIRWGRWSTGTATVNTPGGAQSLDLANANLHWIAGPSFELTPVLPVTGTASFVLVGNTDPTDTLANIGTLGAASLSADFTNRTVASALSLNVGGFTWFAGGNGTFAAGSTQFDGTYSTVSVENLIAGTGNFSGFFTTPNVGGGTVPGAALTYSLLAGATPQLGGVNGVLAFQQGQGNPLPPPPLQQREIAVLVPIAGVQNDFVFTATPAEYAVDADFNLTRLVGPAASADPPELGSFGIGTSAVVEADVNPLILLRWGRWSGGDAVVTNLTTNQTGTLSLAQQSLHWVESADVLNPPAIPQAGIVTYQLAGSTTPTDRSGNLGTLNAASFAADFTNQLVNTTLDVTINNLNWVATGQGVIGAQAGLPDHQFNGIFTGGIINPIQATPTGSFSGFFSAPGSSTPGVPGGVGLSYTMQDGQGVFVVDGAVVFQTP